MSANTDEWRRLEIQVKDLAGQTFESLTAEYRGDKPLALISDLKHLAGYTVINLFAPMHAAFWAAPTYEGILWPCYQSLNDLYGCDSARSLFMKDLREAKIRLTDNQIRLFDAYRKGLNVTGKGVPNLGEGKMNYSEAWRFRSVGIPTHMKDAAMAHLEREVREFGKYAFFRIDESVRLADPRRRSSVGTYLFHNIDILNFRTPADRAQVKQEVLAELKLVVRRLEDGMPFDTPIEPIWMIKGGVGFLMFPAIGQNAPEYDEPVAREILSYRARLVRLLGWPHQYHTVDRALSEFREQVRDLNLGAFSPYDIESELEAYLHEMRQRYPVLGAVAFADARPN